MQIPNKFSQFSLPADLTQTLQASGSKTAAQINCMRIASVIEFYPENLTAQVKLVDKKLVGLNPDGSQILKEYPPIYAKVCYCNPFETFPLTEGMECILLFNDRELETWFINGGSNIQAYPRMHDLTDAVAIVGIRSLPQMIQILTDCLHLFYGQSDIQLKAEQTILNSPQIDLNGINEINATGATITLEGDTIKINGNLIINGQVYTAHTHSNGNEGNPTGGVIQ